MRTKSSAVNAPLPYGCARFRCPCTCHNIIKKSCAKFSCPLLVSLHVPEASTLIGSWSIICRALPHNMALVAIPEPGTHTDLKEHSQLLPKLASLTVKTQGIYLFGLASCVSSVAHG